MSKSYIRRFRLGRFSPPATCLTFHLRRNLHATAARQDAAALDPPELDIPDASQTKPRSMDPRDIVITQKRRELELALRNRGGDPNYTWARYVDLLNIVSPEELPQEVHQAVLRNCSFGPWRARAWLTRRLANRRRPTFAHPHEVRFRSVIFNMRAAGYTPTIHDYHYILQHFASVGHYTGALQVLREIRHLGIERAPKTYRLCFVAMCHKLSLPCYYSQRDGLVQEISKYCSRLLQEMWKDGIPVRPASVDLCMRIFKESMDLEGFERFMKVAYAIDLSYPDRPPLEFWSPTASSPTADNSIPIAPARPLEFSTAALNTALDFLGRLGQVSRLVQTFEVLTTPLRSTTAAAPSSTFEDDEEDDFGDSNPAVASFTRPHASPNTTTYYLLLKWISKAGHATLARHYLLQAIHLDFVEDRRLRGDCVRYAPSEILAPHFAVSRRMILPVYSEANRDKNMELLRWVIVKLQRVLRRKRVHLAFYTQIRDQWSRGLIGDQAIPIDGVVEDPPALTDTTARAEDSEVPSSDTLPPTLPSESSTSTSSDASFAGTSATLPTQSTPQPSPQNLLSTFADLDVDRDDPDFPAEPKPFDIDKHIAILERDKDELEAFERHIIDVLGRNTQRVKERLGRRIWAQQDIYMHTVGSRMKVGRNTWRAIVNFRSDRKSPHHEKTPAQMLVPKDLQPGQIVASVGFFTPSSYAERVLDGPPRAEAETETERERERDLPPHLRVARQELRVSKPEASPSPTEHSGKKQE